MEDSDKVHLILLSLFRIQINARIKCKEVFFNSYQYNDTQLHLNSLIHSLLNQRKYFKGEFKDRNSTEAIQNCEAGNQHKPCSGVWRNGNVHLNIAQDVVRDTHVLEKSETGQIYIVIGTASSKWKILNFSENFYQETCIILK